jgi:hypothetical protein
MHGVYSISVTSHHPSGAGAHMGPGPQGGASSTPSPHDTHTTTTTTTTNSSKDQALPTSHRRHLTVSPRSPTGFQESLNITTWDTALVSPGAKTPFPIGDTRPDLVKGMHFNLVNNVWGTNYVSNWWGKEGGGVLCGTRYPVRRVVVEEHM